MVAPFCIYEQLSKMKLKLSKLLPTLLLCIGMLTGCGTDDSLQFVELSLTTQQTEQIPSGSVEVGDSQQCFFDLSQIPEYAGDAYVTVNGNIPFFTHNESTGQSFETYSPLDELGRCGTAFACVGQDLMPTEERGSIGQIKPRGWHLVKYDCVDGKYLYNRCHLIGYQLTAENANEQNLITGTRYLNVVGMLPFENQVADYVQQTGNHVLYRVTPVFEEENLLASGVLMEGYSVEDNGAGIRFCVYVYNVQPGVQIDYATGESTLVGEATTEPSEPVSTNEPDYVLNNNTRKFHRPSCSSVEDMKPSNREDYSGSRESLMEQGYVPCKRCAP
mgnify:CR=1 FL=1